MGSIFTNVFGAMIGVGILAWVLWAGVVTSAKERMERACAPVTWVGKIGVSFAMLADSSEKSAKVTSDWFEGANYGCQFTLWRVFYEDDWKKERARIAAEQAALEEAAKRQQTPKPKLEDKNK